MLNADFYRDYINAERAHGNQNPIVPVTSLATPLVDVAPDEFIAYSTIPITASGQLAKTSDEIRSVAMPHVFKRTKEGCGQWIDPEKAREAGLTVAGFAPKRGTAYSELMAAMEDSRHEAQRLLHLIVEVYGLPGNSPRVPPEPPPDTVAMPATTQRSTPATTEAVRADPIAPIPPEESATYDDEFFYYLLAKVRDAFEQSDICAYQRQHGLEWWYTICALPLRRNADLLLGLKWGVDASARHQPQTAPPTAAEVAQVRGYRFIARSRPFLERHVGPFERFNYMNVCPFRAPKLTYLTARDWQLAVDHFFLEAIDYLKPPRTVIIGTTDVKVLADRGFAQYEPVKIRIGGKTETGYRGFIQGQTARHPFGAVPQPTYAMTNAARDALWAEVFAG